MKRIVSVLLLLALLLSCLPSLAFAEAAPLATLLFGSDFQNNCYSPRYDRTLYDGVPYEQQPRGQSLAALLHSVATSGKVPDAALFAGDYTDHFQEDGDGDYCAGDGIRQIRSMLNDTFGADYTGQHVTLFSQGNHDAAEAEGIAESGLQPYDANDTYLVYIINEREFPYYQYRIDGAQELVRSTALRLSETLTPLAEAGERRPIFILCHVPLHYSSRYSGMDNTYAQYIFDEVNRLAETLNVFFLFGHNHSGASADYEAAWGGAVNFVARGQTLDVNFDGHTSKEGSNPRALNFTYMNAGYTGYSTSATNETLTLSLITIYDNHVEISRYDKDGEYTCAESLGQTDPRKPSEGEIRNYPIQLPLYLFSDFTIDAVSENPRYGRVICNGETVKAVPSERYELSGWSLVPEDAATVTRVGNEFFFSNLIADCTLTVSFAERVCPSTQFTDVNPSYWYHDGIDFCLAKSLFKGMEETVFAPEQPMTRAMLVTVLYRLENSPVILPSDMFDDVLLELWYYIPVVWASVTGIVHGVDEQHFAPEDNVTREQLATILYRYAVYSHQPVTANGDLEQFTDAASISPYAERAMHWAVGAGLLNGVEEALLEPNGFATRAQIASILMRYCEVVAE